MYLGSFFREALDESPHAIAYNVGRELAGRFPGRAVLETRDCDFDLREYLRAGQCRATPDDSEHHQSLHYWYDEKTEVYPQNVWYEISG